MGELFIDDAVRRRIATKWVGVSLFSLHVWATMLVLAVMTGRESEIIGQMFSTVTFGIGATLVILLFDRAADAVIARITGTMTRETMTRTVTPTGGTDEPAKPSV